MTEGRPGSVPHIPMAAGTANVSATLKTASAPASFKRICHAVIPAGIIANATGPATNSAIAFTASSE